MGNDFGCEVCETRTNARYDIDFKSVNDSPILRVNPKSLDT